jgi:hypothetical protein
MECDDTSGRVRVEAFGEVRENTRIAVTVDGPSGERRGCRFEHWQPLCASGRSRREGVAVAPEAELPA